MEAHAVNTLTGATSDTRDNRAGILKGGGGEKKEKKRRKKEGGEEPTCHQFIEPRVTLVNSNSIQFLKSVLKSFSENPDVDADVHNAAGGGIQSKKLVMILEFE